MALFNHFALGFVVYALISQVSVSQVVVRTKTGNVVGSDREFHGNHYRVFIGIPYAEPPVGSRRFSPPVAKSSGGASGTLNINSFGPSCPQEIGGSAAFSPYFFPRIPREAMEISEDCLRLNVYAPSSDVQTGSGRAVIVWIHGGGYRSGQGSAYDAAALAVQNLVVVTINYRLGPFGFLFTEDANAPGNLGLMDQQLALQWVRDNIEAFGGDPNRVTLSGQADVHGSPSLHIFAKNSRELFHRVIAHSGVFQPGELQQSTNAASDTKLFAELANCPNGKTSSLVEFLRGKTVDELLATDRLFSRRNNSSYVWRPVFASEFFIKDPIAPPKYDIISVFSSGEGSLALELLKDLYPNRKLCSFTEGIDKEQWNRFFDVYVDPSKVMHLAVEHEYIGGETSDKYVAQLQALHQNGENSDKSFARLQALVKAELERRYARHGEKPLKDLGLVISSSHLMVFDHKSSTDKRYPGLNLVPHGSELAYVFGLPFVATNTRTRFTDDERKLSQRMITYWANFAKTGNPNMGEKATNGIEPNWPESGLSKKYLQVQLQGVQVGVAFHKKGVSFWNGYLNGLTKSAKKSCRLRRIGFGKSTECKQPEIGEHLGLSLNPQQAQALIEGLMFSLIGVVGAGFLVVAVALGFWFKIKGKKKPEPARGFPWSYEPVPKAYGDSRPFRTDR